MEAQESCGRTWQFRIFLGSFLAVTVKTSPFLHGMHTKTFHLLPPCMDHDGVQPMRTIYNLQNISLAFTAKGIKNQINILLTIDLCCCALCPGLKDEPLIFF